jgi:hypothetical protein
VWLCEVHGCLGRLLSLRQRYGTGSAVPLPIGGRQASSELLEELLVDVAGNRLWPARAPWRPS